MKSDTPKLSLSAAATQIHKALGYECLSASEVRWIKLHYQEIYTNFAQMFDNKIFLNWGLLDEKIVNEYQALHHDFSTLCASQDIHSQVLIYYLVRPLIKNRFFNKRIVDIGSGTGISLRVSSALLETKFAVGIDLVHQLASNANTNFHLPNKVNYIQSDAESLPLANGSVDIITNLESSHLYPRIEHFFSEVERVLAPGGYFCYSDMHFNNKQQAIRLDNFIENSKTLKIILKQDITKMVQASIYQRLIANEAVFYINANAYFQHDKELLASELPYLIAIMGLPFLPWWRIWFKNPALKPIAKYFRNTKYPWGKKYYFYYLIQKVEQ